MLLACYLYVVNMSAACISVFSILFADAEAGEDGGEEVGGGDVADDGGEGGDDGAEVLGDEVAGDGGAGGEGGDDGVEGEEGVGKGLAVAGVGDDDVGLVEVVAGGAEYGGAECVESLACGCAYVDGVDGAVDGAQGVEAAQEVGVLAQGVGGGDVGFVDGDDEVGVEGGVGGRKGVGVKGRGGGVEDEYDDAGCVDGAS